MVLRTCIRLGAGSLSPSPSYIVGTLRRDCFNTDKSTSGIRRMLDLTTRYSNAWESRSASEAPELGGAARVLGKDGCGRTRNDHKAGRGPRYQYHHKGVRTKTPCQKTTHLPRPIFAADRRLGLQPRTVSAFDGLLCPLSLRHKDRSPLRMPRDRPGIRRHCDKVLNSSSPLSPMLPAALPWIPTLRLLMPMSRTDENRPLGLLSTFAMFSTCGWMMVAGRGLTKSVS